MSHKPWNAVDLTGKSFGKLTVIERINNYIEPCGEKKAKWQCLCECGNTIHVTTSHLTTGHTKSCGCSKNQGTYKHGCHNTRLYSVWEGMRSRCNNQNSSNFERYGRRGIKVCEDWDDFIQFKEWAEANGYYATAEYGECTIDRIDNSKGYSPNNCRFVPMSVQAFNKRNTKRRIANEKLG